MIRINLLSAEREKVKRRPAFQLGQRLVINLAERGKSTRNHVLELALAKARGLAVERRRIRLDRGGRDRAKPEHQRYATRQAQPQAQARYRVGAR